MRKQTDTKLMEVLTEEQKTSLEKMKGEKLDIPASEFPRFGGQGGPGGGDRRRPPPKKDE